MEKRIVIGNGLALGAMVFVNYLSNTGLMNNTTIGTVSNAYRSLFTPAGYAFSIWGLIYLLLFAFCIRQAQLLYRKDYTRLSVKQIGVWFVLTCLFNSLWVFSWVYEYMGVSVVCIFALLIALFQILLRLEPLRKGNSQVFRIFVHTPFVLYAGWVSVASIANVATYLVKIEWNAFGIPHVLWAFVLIGVAVLLNLFMLFRFRMYGFVCVGVWALLAIGNANMDSSLGVGAAAFGASALLVAACIAKRFFGTEQRLR